MTPLNGFGPRTAEAQIVTPTIASLIPAWRASLVAAGRAERTISSYTDHLAEFLVSLGSQATIAEITHTAIGAYQRRIASRLAAKTTGLALTAIRSFCRFLIEAEIRSDDPTLRIRFPKVRKALPRALSIAQVRALLAALTVPDGLSEPAAFQWRRNRLIVHLMLYGGLRISEVAAIRGRDVDLEGRRLTVHGKGGKDRVIPIHPAVLGDLGLAAAGRRDGDAICGKPNGDPLTVKSLHHVFERWIPRLKLSFTFTAHQLRHTAITEMISRGANIFDVQEVAGHESPETTRIYYRMSAEHLRSAVERLPAIW